MANHNEDKAHLLELLKQHRANLQTLRKQHAIYAEGEKRLSLLNQIFAEEKAIREAKAKLRQLGVEPEPATIDPPEKFEPFAEHVIKTYPLPIAKACADFNREPELGRKFVALDRLITHLIKYLAAIFIGQARRDKPPDYPLPEKLEWIAKPTLESWTEAIRELSELYKKTPWQEKWKLADLLHACTRRMRDKKELVDAIDYLTLQLHKSGIDEPSVVDFLQLLAWTREIRIEKISYEIRLSYCRDVETFSVALYLTGLVSRKRMAGRRSPISSRENRAVDVALAAGGGRAAQRAGTPATLPVGLRGTG